jgi:SAM-dependent methyltransferase
MAPEDRSARPDSAHAGSYFMEPAVYDQVYASVTADQVTHRALMEGARGRALEVCCGNGRLLLPTREAGIDCDGLDLDPAMLDDLRTKLATRSLTATLFHADMRDFTLPGRYALIAIPFNSFLHNLTQDDQLATLRCCRQHLEEGGRLAITIFHPSAAKLIEMSQAERLSLDLPLGERRIKVWDGAEDDRVEQIRTISRRVEYFDASDVLIEEKKYRFEMRYIYKPEMELLLRVAGFGRWEARPAFADYRDAASVAGDRGPQEGDNLLYVAWRS